jgi:hypothetical protein
MTAMTDATETRTTEAPRTAPSSFADDPTAESTRPFADFLEQGLAQAMEAHERMLGAVEALEQVFAKAAKGSTDCHLRMVEMTQANANAAYDLVGELMAAESLAQLIALSANGARCQVDTAAAQFKELSGLARRVATDAAEPISANLSRAFTSTA